MLKLSIVTFLAASLAFAEATQKMGNQGGWTTNRETEPVTVSGKVLKAEKFKDQSTGEVGANIQLETGEGKLNIHVGPMWFTSVGSSVPKIGEPMTVVGFRFSFDKNPELVAKEITIHGKKFKVWEKSDREIAKDSDKGNNK